MRAESEGVGKGAGAEGAIPALALTAHARVEDRLAALEAGFTEHVGEPVGVEALVELVRRLAARAAG